MPLNNIRRVWDEVDLIDRREGRDAYFNYHKSLKVIAAHFDVGFVQTVAAFTALSPSNDYLGNIRSLISVIVGIKNGTPPERITVTTFDACKMRAHAYMKGDRDFLVETHGQKTRHFYMNILKPRDRNFVTIDGHMYSIWVGRRLRMREAVEAKFDYQRVSRDFIKFSKRVRMLPNQVQATLWFTWKRINNIVFKPQLSLFNSNDQWGLIIAADQVIGIKSYDKKKRG